MLKFLIQYPPRYSRGYVPSPPANRENLQNIDAVLKQLCTILHTLKYASQTQDSEVVLRHTLPVFTGLGRCPIVS